MKQDTGKSACVIVIRPDAKVLVVSRKKGDGFAFPGGKQEPNGESLKVCACRELYEEVGAITLPGRLALLHVGPSPSGRIVHLYYAHKITGVPYAKEYGTTIGWFDFESLLNSTPFADFYKAAFPDGIDHLRPTEVLVV